MDQLTSFLLEGYWKTPHLPAGRHLRGMAGFLSSLRRTILFVGCSFTETDVLGRKPVTNPYAFNQINFDGDEP